MIKEYKFRNIAYLFYNSAPEIKENEQVKDLLRSYDRYINVFWKMSHLMASSRHLPNTEGGSGGDTGTGGTNWRAYLPPKFQKLFFYETLWTEEEKRDWGKSAIMAAFRERVEANWSTIKEKRE
jgi:tryptophan 2,3-dioxygenase